MAVPDTGSTTSGTEKSREASRRATLAGTSATDEVVARLAAIVPSLAKILIEPDRILNAANTISAHVVTPALRSRAFPDSVSASTLALLGQLSRVPGNQKTWRKDVADAFNDPRFFSSRPLTVVETYWLPLLRSWALADKERMPELISRLSPPTTAGIVFGVGATSARLDADRKTQLSLRRIALVILATPPDSFGSDMAAILDKVTELLAATPTSSPSSTSRADVYLVMRALVLRSSPIHLAALWPLITSELATSITSTALPDTDPQSAHHPPPAVLQACKLLDVLLCVAPDDFQLHEWLFVTDTITAVHRANTAPPSTALVDRVSDLLGSADLVAPPPSAMRRPLIQSPVHDDALEHRHVLVTQVLRPFFGGLSIAAFEATYRSGGEEYDAAFCMAGLLADLFDERTMVRPL